MAQLKIGSAPSKPTREKREEALERLLLLAITLMPDDLSRMEEGDQEMAEALTGEASFWLDFVPRGMKPSPSVPEQRIGWKDVQTRRAAYRLDGDSLVPSNTPVAPCPKDGAK